MPIFQCGNRLAAFAMLLILLPGQFAFVKCAADESPPADGAEAVPEIPFTLLKVRVTDPDGAPIPLATISPVGLRTKVERGSHYGWGEKTHGKRPSTTTDEQGLAEIRCPQFVYEKVETGVVTLLVEHPDYVTFREDRPVGDAVAEVSLEYGRLMVVSAIDADTGQPIIDHLHGILSGYGSAHEWSPLSGGRLISRTVDRNRIRLRLVSLPPDGPLKFSDIIDLSEYGTKRRVLLKDVEVHAGVRVEGRLGDNVPRPVHNGVAIAYVSVGIEANGWDHSVVNEWYDWVNISEDGTFVFKSLPRGAVAGVIAVCDGWVCTAPAPADFVRLGVADHVTKHGGNRVQPQLVKLHGNLVTPVIEMESTATCRIKVVTKDGDPIAGADVGMWPNQITMSGGSTFVGSGYSMRVLLDMPPDGLDVGWSAERQKQLVAAGVKTNDTRYYKQTDEDGIVEIRTLPGGVEGQPRRASVSVTHDLFEQPSSEDNRLRRETDVQLIRDEVTEVTIIMDRKGTKVIQD